MHGELSKGIVAAPASSLVSFSRWVQPETEAKAENSSGVGKRRKIMKKKKMGEKHKQIVIF